MTERDQSEFNSAVSYLNRLNTLFITADESAIMLNPYKWFHVLMALFRELSTELSEDEIENWNKKTHRVAMNVNKHIDQLNRGHFIGMPQDLYEQLHEFEMFLRNVMKESGLQQRIKDDAIDALR